MATNQPKLKKKIEASIITLGNGQVGKTSLIIRFIENSFTFNYLTTIGIDSKFKNVKVLDDETIRVQLTDTAGQEKFSSLSYNYIKNSEGIIFVYDITNEESFKGISDWITKVDETVNITRPSILVGNKSDLEEKRIISTEEGRAFANQKGMHFFETSCQTGVNVGKAFMDLVQQIYEKKKSSGKTDDENIRINKKNLKKIKRKNVAEL